MAMVGGTRVMGRIGMSVAVSFPSRIPHVHCMTEAWRSLPKFPLNHQDAHFCKPSKASQFIVRSSTGSASSVSSSASSAATELTDLLSELDVLDIRVGKIIKAWKHPEADSLYVEEVDLGEADGPRTICSGLVKYMPVEELQDRPVVVLANLKARNMRGVKSNGMLMAASDASHEIVQLLSPPEGAVIGERIWFGSEADQTSQSPAGTPNQVQKKKVWESIQPLLTTDNACVAAFQLRPMRASTGFVTCKSLKQASIS